MLDLCCALTWVCCCLLVFVAGVLATCVVLWVGVWVLWRSFPPLVCMFGVCC